MTQVSNIVFGEDFIQKLASKTQQLILREHNQLILDLTSEGGKAAQVAHQALNRVFLAKAIYAQDKYLALMKQEKELSTDVVKLQNSKTQAEGFKPVKFWSYYSKSISNYFDNIINHSTSSKPLPAHFKKIAFNLISSMLIIIASAILLATLTTVPLFFSMILPITLAIATVLITGITIAVAVLIAKDLNKQNAKSQMETSAILKETNAELPNKTKNLAELQKAIGAIFEELDGLTSNNLNPKNDGAQEGISFVNRDRQSALVAPSSNLSLFAKPVSSDASSMESSLNNVESSFNPS